MPLVALLIRGLDRLLLRERLAERSLDRDFLGLRFRFFDREVRFLEREGLRVREGFRLREREYLRGFRDFRDLRLERDLILLFIIKKMLFMLGRSL